MRTFEQASIAWQTVPHWNVGDPGQAIISNELRGTIAAPPPPPPFPALPPPFASEPVALTKETVAFQVTLAQATASTPDALLAAVLAKTVELAQRVDTQVLAALAKAAVDAAALPWYRLLAAPVPPAPPTSVDTILGALIDGRELLEDSGYRAGSCLIASKPYYVNINQWVTDTVATGGLLMAGGVDSLHRSSQLPTGPPAAGPAQLMLMLGRAREIPHCCAAGASPGEEPFDLAVSVPPSLEVIGEAGGNVALAVRIRFVTRVKDQRGVIVFHDR